MGDRQDGPGGEGTASQGARRVPQALPRQVGAARQRRWSRRDLLGTATGIALAATAATAARGGTERRSWLLPPGAADGDEFFAACIRCGQCVEVCPRATLRLRTQGPWGALGTPYFEPRRRACDLCFGLEAMACCATCPTGALRETSRDRVAIGVAVVDRERCLAWQGTPCKACWNRCPFPNAALRLDWRRRPLIDPERCTGCGLCEEVCLTEDPSIRVVPERP